MFAFVVESFLLLSSKGGIPRSILFCGAGTQISSNLSISMATFTLQSWLQAAWKSQIGTDHSPGISVATMAQPGKPFMSAKDPWPSKSPNCPILSQLRNQNLRWGILNTFPETMVVGDDITSGTIQWGCFILEEGLFLLKKTKFMLNGWSLTHLIYIHQWMVSLSFNMLRSPFSDSMIFAVKFTGAFYAGNFREWSISSLVMSSSQPPPATPSNPSSNPTCLTHQ